MSSVTESNLGLNYGWAYGESGWNTGMDDNLVKLGFASRNQVKGILSAPPSTPSNGDAYIVGTSPTGLFSGNFGKVAIWDRTVWLFLTPKNHEVVYNVADGCDYKYDNGWVLKQEDELSPYVKVKDFTFSTGYTITDQKQCLLNLADNKYYQWFGALPKVIPAGSTPATAGGVGDSLWVDKGDLSVSHDIYDTLATDGAIRRVKPVSSVSVISTLQSPLHGDRIDVIGFYSDNLRGGGTFVFDSVKPKSLHDGITVISPSVPFDGTQPSLINFLNGVGEADVDGAGCWVRLLRDATVSTSMSGAIIDGITDDTPACQAAHDTGYHVEYDAGNYLFVGGGVVPQAGPYIFSQGSGFFNQSSSRTVSIINNDVDGSIFNYSVDTSTGQKDAPRIRGFRLKADYPIRLNSHTVFIGEGALGVNPYLMRPSVTDNYIEARSSGIGIGIAAVKCFDGEIANNEVYNFAVNILLYGSDINSIHRNRLVGATLYQICDRSAQTFGSQNEIYNNDILSGGLGCTYIKSNSFHVRIYDNYCEQPSTNIVGFIDIGGADMPAWAPSNVDGSPYSVEVVGNRLDGHNFCTSFVYKLHTDVPPVYTKIHDVGTTGTPNTVAKTLLMTSLLRFRKGDGNVNNCNYDLKGPMFGRYNGFVSESFKDTYTLTAKNIIDCIGGDIYANGAEPHVRTNGESIVLMPTLTVPLYAGFEPDNDGGINPYFTNGTTYTVTVYARTTSGAGDTLRIARLTGGAGDPLNSFVLDQQFRKFTFNMLGADYTARTGIYMDRTTFNGNIEIKNISFTS